MGNVIKIFYNKEIKIAKKEEKLKNEYFIAKNKENFVKHLEMYKFITKESDFNNYDKMETFYFYNGEKIIVKVFVKITYRNNTDNDIIDFFDNPFIDKDINSLE